MEPSPISGMGGGWIDSDGKLHEVDHDRELHHAEIIAQMFGTPKVADPINLIPEMFVDFAIHHGWVRIIVNRSNGIFFHFSPKFLKKPAYRTMVYIVQGRMLAVSTEFPEYGFDVVSPTVYVTFSTPKAAMRWLNENIRSHVF